MNLIYPVLESNKRFESYEPLGHKKVWIFHVDNRTGASPGTFFTVSGTERMVPAEDPKEHFGTKRRVVVWLYISKRSDIL